jgi:hypothetical protein
MIAGIDAQSYSCSIYLQLQMKYEFGKLKCCIRLAMIYGRDVLDVFESRKYQLYASGVNLT